MGSIRSIYCIEYKPRQEHKPLEFFFTEAFTPFILDGVEYDPEELARAADHGLDLREYRFINFW